MVFAIILASLVVIVGLLALSIKLFKWEKQYYIVQSAVLRWLRKVFSCICIFFRVIGLALAHFFVWLAMLIKKIFTKKPRKDKKKVKEKKTVQKKESPTDEKGGRVVRQYSKTRPILLPPEPEEQKVQEVVSQPVEQQENIVPESEMADDGKEPVEHYAPINDETSESDEFMPYPSPAEISRLRQEAIFREQQRVMEQYDSPRFNLSAQPYKESVDIENRRRELAQSLKDISPLEEPVPIHTSTPRFSLHSSTPLTNEGEKKASLRDFVGKSFLTPQKKTTPPEDDIDLNKLPEDIKREIIKEYWHKDEDA